MRRIEQAQLASCWLVLLFAIVDVAICGRGEREKEDSIKSWLRILHILHRRCQGDHTYRGIVEREATGILEIVIEVVVRYASCGAENVIHTIKM